MTEKLFTNFEANYRVIEENITKAAEQSGKKREDIILLAATKTVSPELINYAINSGIKYIGENRVQEFLSKEADLLTTAHRHFIGHLQSNKAKDIVDAQHCCTQQVRLKTNAVSVTAGYLEDRSQASILHCHAGGQRTHTHNRGLVIGDIHSSNAAEVCGGLFNQVINMDTLGRANLGSYNKLTVIKQFCNSHILYTPILVGYSASLLGL